MKADGHHINFMTCHCCVKFVALSPSGQKGQLLYLPSLWVRNKNGLQLAKCFTNRFLIDRPALCDEISTNCTALINFQRDCESDLNVFQTAMLGVFTHHSWEEADGGTRVIAECWLCGRTAVVEARCSVKESQPLTAAFRQWACVWCRRSIRPGCNQQYINQFDWWIIKCRKDELLSNSVHFFHLAQACIKGSKGALYYGDHAW